MIEAVSVENVATVFHAADRLGVQGLRDYCLAFIVDGFDLVSHTPAYHDMCRANPELNIQVLTKRSVKKADA